MQIFSPQKKNITKVQSLFFYLNRKKSLYHFYFFVFASA